MSTLFLPIAFACFKVGGCMFYAPEPPEPTHKACIGVLTEKVRPAVLNSKGQLLSYATTCQPIEIKKDGTT